MMKNFYLRVFIMALALMVLAADGLSQKPIMLVGRESGGPYQSDIDMVDSLTAWGYAPVFWTSEEFQARVDANFNDLNYEDYEAIVILESVDSKAMAAFGTTDDYPLPCVNMEGYAVATGNDRWEWISDNGTGLFQTAGGEGTMDDQILIIKDNSHYITQIFNTGDEVVWSANETAEDILQIAPVSIVEENVSFDGKLGQMKSHAGMSNFWNLVTVDEIGGPGNKFVFWGINHIGLDGAVDPGPSESYGTPEFYTIVRRSVEWILDETGGGTSIEAPLADQMELVAYPNPAADRITIRFRSNSAQPYTATLYNVAGQQVELLKRQTHAGRNYLFLDAGKYPAGVYQMRIDLEEGAALTKVVIQ
jgi:hypothetical protein